MARRGFRGKRSRACTTYCYSRFTFQGGLAVHVAFRHARPNARVGLRVLRGILRGFVAVLAAIQEKKKGDGSMAATEAKFSKEDILSAVESMTVLELSELVKGFEDKFGVTAAAPMAVAAAPGAAAAPAAEEKDSFDVVLAGFPADKKIQVIKVVTRDHRPGLEGSQRFGRGCSEARQGGCG